MTTVEQKNTNSVEESSTTEFATDLEAQRKRSREDKLIAKAIYVLHRRLTVYGQLLTSARSVRDYLALQLSDRDNEVFSCLFLDNQHRLIEYREIFFGTIDGCSVYPRVIVKLALQVNAAAVVFAHNHPSGVAEPSQADMRITERLTQALELIDVRVLDHLVVGGREIVSFAEQGLLV